MRVRLSRGARWLAAGWLGLAPAGWAEQAGETPRVTLVRAGTLLDAAAGEVRRDQEILIEGERILAVGDDLEAPAGATASTCRTGWSCRG